MTDTTRAELAKRLDEFAASGRERMPRQTDLDALAVIEMAEQSAAALRLAEAEVERMAKMERVCKVASEVHATFWNKDAHYPALRELGDALASLSGKCDG